MKNFNFKRTLAIMLTLNLTLSLLPTNAFAVTVAKDIDGHWAASAIETCHTYGIMNSDNGYYRPNADITRAEFAAMVNRAFGYDTLDVPELTGYKDVPSNKWYANDMRTAIALGIIEGYGNGIAAPDDKITREQAAVILYKVLRLNTTDAAATKFTDMDDVSSWAKDAVLAMEQSGYITGSNNQFISKKNITRGETAQLILNVTGVIVDSDFDANGAAYQNVTIRKAGMTLKNVVITGDLFITEGVGDGDVWLDTVQIGGRLLATGGGENSIHVKDITVGDNVVVDKPPVAGEQPVRFRAVQTSDTTVIFAGTAREVIITEDVIIIIDNDGEKTVFNMFKPEDGSAKPTVVISESAAVEKITAFVPTEIQGGGEVGKVEAHTDGVTVDASVKVEPGNVEAEKGVDVKVGGETVTGTGIENPTTKPSDPASPTDPTPAPSPDPTPAPTTPLSTGGSSGGGGNGSGTTTTNAKTPTISTQPQGASVTIGTTHTLTASASVADGGTLSYQWYSNTSASTSGGTAISGANSASYATHINTAGTFYYYVVVTNTNNSVNGTKTASVTSNAVTLTVNLIPITSAAITVTAPVKGDTPNTTAGGTGNFSVGTVSWTPNDNPFQSGTQYSATVTLAVDANYTFTGGLSTATINGYTATVVNNGATATLSYQFAATANKTVTGIAVKTQLSKLTYTHDDMLDLTGLEVTLTYDDSTTENVALTDFAAKSISANPVNGAALVRSIHDGQPITVSCGGQSANTNNLAVGKAAAPVITFPAAAAITYGAALSTSALTGGSTEYGTFAWTTGTTVPPVLNSGYQVTFTPSSDTLANYETIANTTATVPITVNKANLTLTVGGDNLVLTPFENTAFTYNVTGLLGSDLASVTCTTSGVEVWSSYLYISGAVTSTDVTLGFTANAGNNYNNATATLPVKVYDGKTEDRAIPLTNSNIATFNDYVNSGTASEKNAKLKLHYKLDDNIALTANWMPVGYEFNGSSYEFTGSFDGGGYTISGLTAMSGSTKKGFFAKIGTAGVVKNLKVTGSLSGENITGVIAAQNYGKVDNCETNVNITAVTSYSGGIVGQNYGIVRNCVAKGSFTGSDSFSGGVVGLNSGTGAIVQGCSATGAVNITGSDGNDVGGLVGSNSNSATIKDSYFTGSITSEKQYTGGIVGQNRDGGTVQNCYATGSVSGYYAVGGIVGKSSGTVKDCIALNQSVTASNQYLSTGRVAGDNNSGSLTDNYAWTGMTVTITGGTWTKDEGADKKDGANLSVADAAISTTWTALGFSAAIWDFTDLGTKLPALKNVGDAQDWPVWLVDPLTLTTDEQALDNGLKAKILTGAEATVTVKSNEINIVESSGSGGITGSHTKTVYVYIPVNLTGYFKITADVTVNSRSATSGTNGVFMGYSTGMDGVSPFVSIAMRGDGGYNMYRRKTDGTGAGSGNTTGIVSYNVGVPSTLGIERRDGYKAYSTVNDADFKNTNDFDSVLMNETFNGYVFIAVNSANVTISNLKIVDGSGTVIYSQSGDYTAVPTMFTLQQFATVSVATIDSAIARILPDGETTGEFMVGETVTVTATPDEGWTFAYWQDENGEIVSYDAEYTFVVLDDASLTAVFVEEAASAQAEPTGLEITPAAEPRKEPDPVIVPDNDDESESPDGYGNDSNDGDDGGLPDGGEDIGRMTPQEAIATLNNLLAMCGTVTRG